MPYFDQLHSSLPKDAGRTDLYVHSSRLREKILAAGRDIVSTHRGKEVVLEFAKDVEEAMNIACNTESDMLQLSKAAQTTDVQIKSYLCATRHAFTPFCSIHLILWPYI